MARIIIYTELVTLYQELILFRNHMRHFIFL